MKTDPWIAIGDGRWTLSRPNKILVIIPSHDAYCLVTWRPWLIAGGHENWNEKEQESTITYFDLERAKLEGAIWAEKGW